MRGRDNDETRRTFSAKQNKNANNEDNSDLRGRDSTPTCEEDTHKKQDEPFPRKNLAVKPKEESETKPEREHAQDSDLR